eukprot:scaffold161764_cov28-Cyclotella_meneghiniana.AAC.1
MGDDESPLMSVAQRIAALQKQQEQGGKHTPLSPPQQPPSEKSDRIANLQKTVEPAFLSGREKAGEEAAKRADVDDDVAEEEDPETKPKKPFKPPPGAVQVMLPFAPKK